MAVLPGQDFDAAEAAALGRPVTPLTTPPQPATAPNVRVGGRDWQALIEADPVYRAYATRRTGALSNLATGRAEAVRGLAAKYGFLPPGFKDEFGDLRPEDVQAGAENPFSVASNIRRQYGQGVDQMRKGLAARGALQSGELGYGQGQADLARAGSEYGAGQDFMSALHSALNQYTGGVSDIEGERAGAIGQAEQNVAQQYPGDTAKNATLDPHLTAQAGFPVYRDEAGAIWRIDANTGLPVIVAQAGQPITYAGLGVTPEPIVGPGPQGMISSDMGSTSGSGITPPFDPYEQTRYGGVR